MKPVTYKYIFGYQVVPMYCNEGRDFDYKRARNIKAVSKSYSIKYNLPLTYLNRNNLNFACITMKISPKIPVRL